MRFGIFGLRKKALESSELEVGPLYMFCSKSGKQIKSLKSCIHRHGFAKTNLSNKKYLKIVNNIYDYLHEIKTKDGTPLRAAINYFLNREEESKTFLLDGHIPISNNICERAIKPFAIMRRNVLFAKTENGASISRRLFTTIQTAKANGLIVDKYLEYILENIGKTDIENLLPWSEKIPKGLSIKQYIK